MSSRRNKWVYFCVINTSAKLTPSLYPKWYDPEKLIYDTVLESMKTEFFSQDPKDAERTKALQLEFVQNVRSYR